ncbi:MAG: phage/plasmid primase, P4 family [Phycisphaerae bacterium]
MSTYAVVAAPGPGCGPDGSGLDEKHRLELRASGIEDGLIARAGIYSAGGDEIRRLLGWQPREFSWGRGWVIPFDRDGVDASYCRVKLDFPRCDRDGRPIKYESPRSAPNRAYFPPGFEEAAQRATEPILLTEGEKKALAAIQHGFPCLGLVGVWGFAEKRGRRRTGSATGPRELLPDLNRVQWNGRRVYVLFDSDGVDKPDVRMAEREVSRLLRGRGADVRIIRLPKLADGKTGLDDFLVAKGADALRELLSAAPTFAGGKDVVAAGDDRPMVLADMLISERYLRDGTPLARHWRDELHEYDGRCFRRIANNDLSKIVLVWLDKVNDRARPRLARDVVEALGARLLVRAEVEQPVWLGDPKDGPANPADWVVMQNCILDIPAALEGRLACRPHTPLWFCANVLPADYDPDARCPQWFAFLDDVFDGDLQRVNLLSEWFGYCITSDTSLQAIMLLEGPRRSGKGTTLRQLRRVVGEHNCVAPRLSTLTELFGLQGLLGKTCAICPDAHLGSGDKALSTLEILKSISGEDCLEVHRKNLPSVNARLRTRFTIGVNELPHFGDAAGALGSRLLILPYRNSYVGREDRKLEEKLAAEIPGTINWSLEGLRRLRAQGRFTEPGISAEVRRDFERLSSPVAAFLQDCCVMNAKASADRDVLWDAWKAWCERNGHHSGGRDRFGNRLRLLVPGLLRSQPRRPDGTRGNTYTGIRLRVEGTP